MTVIDLLLLQLNKVLKRKMFHLRVIQPLNTNWKEILNKEGFVEEQVFPFDPSL